MGLLPTSLKVNVRQIEAGIEGGLVILTVRSVWLHVAGAVRYVRDPPRLSGQL